MIKKIIVLMLLIFIVGCAMPVEETKETVETAPTTESAATDIQEDISDVGTIDADLDIEALGDIEKEIDEIDW